jgi:hypothetical protein
MMPPRAARTWTAALCLASAALWNPAGGVAAAPSPLAVSASLEPAEIRVGDVARLTVTVANPAGGNVALPELAQGRAVVALDRRRETAAGGAGAAAGRERTTFVVSLTSYEVGERDVGGGTVTYSGPGGPLASALPATVLRTRSLLRGDDTPPRGARLPVRWPPASRGRGALAVAAVLLAAAAAAAVRHRASRRRSRPPAARPPEAPQEQALRALAALRARATDGPDAEAWHRELSDVARRYLEGRFGLRAPERTTEELIREAAVPGRLAPSHQELVRSFLAHCDLVKFARHRPSPGDVSRALAAAERLVRETAPPAAPGRGARSGGGR